MSVHKKYLGIGAVQCCEVFMLLPIHNRVKVFMKSYYKFKCLKIQLGKLHCRYSLIDTIRDILCKSGMKPCKSSFFHYTIAQSRFWKDGSVCDPEKIGSRSLVSKSRIQKSGSLLFKKRRSQAAYVVSCPTCTKYLEWYLVGICIKVCLLCYVLQIFDGMKIDFILLATFATSPP